MFFLKLLPLFACLLFTFYCWHRSNVEHDPVDGYLWVLGSRVGIALASAYFLGILVQWFSSW